MPWFDDISGGLTVGRSRRSAAVGASDGDARDAQGDEPLSDRRRARSRRGGNGLASAGRLVLWACIGLVLIRGLGATLGSSDATDRGAVAAAHGSRFPDGEARAFAVRFTQAYLGGSSRGPEQHRKAITAFFADDVRDRIAAAVHPTKGSGAQVAWATVAREVALGPSRALITVAASTGVAVRYLTVPVARDRAGGLVIFDLPSLSAPPPKGTVETPESVALPDVQARPITDLVTRFLTAYLAGGDRAALGYFLAPGTRLVQMSRGLQVVGVEQVARDPHPVRAGLGVVAQVRVRDRARGAELALRYRLTVIERERWYVRAVAGGPTA